MTDHDDHEGIDTRTDHDGSSSFVMGLLAGTVLGAGLGMLFAPRSGSELRRRIADQAGAFTMRPGVDEPNPLVSEGTEAVPVGLFGVEPDRAGG